ncbi:MFS transporter [Pseudomonas vanderleydeniana]|uniref:MFS transporter n=2 Tax=Pseudomonas vanderleydeniana TaxID=2745495 RepID=A0A9E6TVD7_9PSED|nr:MFS transporter [Pseudomonas vanderleydeniana]
MAGNLRQQQATRRIFFLAGLGMSAWAPLIPFVKARLGIGDGTLGLLLFCIAAGSMLVMPFTGRALARFGCRALILVCATLFCGVLPFMLYASAIPEIALALLLFGAVNGLLDVSMNAQAVIVERDSGQAKMSGFHGFYSIGSVAGAGGVSLMLWAGLEPLQAILLVVLLIAVLTMQACAHLLGRRQPEPGETSGLLQALAQPSLLFIALLCFFIFMIEGAMLDWSAVFLHSERGMDKSHAGFGFTLYALAVALCRLGGDRLVNAVGHQRMLVAGAGCAALGLLLIVSIDLPAVALGGFVLAGIGLSNIVPILFSTAGNHPRVPSGMALSAVTLIGYSGLLSGPALIGLVARHASLSAAFAAGVVIMLLVGASARRITGKQPKATR